jgi:hypothetical protein
LPPLATVTVSDSSDTYRRIGPDSEKLPRALRFPAAQHHPPDGERQRGGCSPLDTECNLPWLNRDIPAHFSFLTTIVRQRPLVNPAGEPLGPVCAASAEARTPHGAGKTWPVRGLSMGSAMRERTARANRRSHQGRKPGTVIPVRKLEDAEVPEGDLRRFCVCHGRVAHGPATEASWGRTAPDVRGGRANGARPS